MREFVPDRIQRLDLNEELLKVNRAEVKRGVTGIAAAVGIGVPFFVIATSAGEDLPLPFWLIIGGLSAATFFLGIWMLIHGVYSQNKNFENYKYYVCTVLDKQTYYGGNRRSKSSLFYLTFHGLKGEQRQTQVEGDFFESLGVGGKFIIAKSKGMKHFLPYAFSQSKETPAEFE
jgi:hypothetical protein